MNCKDKDFSSGDYLILISLATLSIYLLLFIFREHDNNSLTSWRWVFGQTGGGRFFLLLIAALCSAWVLQLTSFYEKPVFLFLASFLAGSLFWQEPEVIVDAARYFGQAKTLEFLGLGYFSRQWGGEIFAWTDLPLMPLFYGAIFKFLGEQRIFIQIFTTTLFSLTTILTYLLGKTLWDEEVGFWGGVLLLGFPYIFTQVPLMLVDIPTMFFLLLSILTMVEAMKGGGWWRVALAGGAFFLAFMVKYSTWLLLTVHFFIFINFFIKAPRPTLKRSFFVVFLFLFLVIMALGSRYEFILEQIKFINEYQKPGLGRWGESFVSTFFFQTHPFISLAALFSLFLALKKRDFKYLIIAYLVLLIFVLQIKRIRYTLPVFPLLALMASYGLVAIKDRKVRKFIALCAVSFSLVLALAGYLPFLKNMGVANLQAAGRFLDQSNINRVEIMTFLEKHSVINPDISVPLLDIYTSKELLCESGEVTREKLASVRTSSLRFTWEYPVAGFYRTAGSPPPVVDGLVVIGTGKGQSLPVEVESRAAAYKNRIKFFKNDGVFRYQAPVLIYYNDT